MDFTLQTVLVTGASAGIGTRLAAEAERIGATVTAFVTRHFMSRTFVAKIVGRMVAPAT